MELLLKIDKRIVEIWKAANKLEKESKIVNLDDKK